VIVVDTNIISYLYLSTKQTVLVEQVLRKDSRWAAPLLWRSEFRSVLALYIKKKIISLEKALAVQQEAEDFLQENEFEVPSTQVLSLAATSSLSAYDCEFVALAQVLDSPLVTADKQIIRDFPQTAYSPRQFLRL
jgi:predicted nucleic acid-binding protein